MAATMAAMAIINAKCLSSTTTPKVATKLTAAKPTSVLSFQNLPKGLTLSKPIELSNMSPSLAGTAIAGAIFSTLSASDPALAAQQVAQIAEGDNRGLALLLPIIPAIAWVLFNILQPALNQINRMTNKSVVVGLGLGGLAASGFVSTPEASAGEIAMIAADAAGDNRGQLLLFVVAPAILWVLYNILQPALNQINRMRS
ncbi:photosystem II core complex proteins psbY, chloroplastic-like [Pyrus x bretschneideri]|uniref:photosystem II core complex proteins psbY, chloroplastic-like n=1 Tax=Pyrus x bretschneideri TaxID=225117 RepID=UPI00202E76CF|nr:photosystem II core complex proteins psbY, chloroplastic-like [Pyrus x bretschneideri]